MSTINLDRIQEWIDQGRLDPTKPITLKELADSRCLHGVKKDGVKVLARGKEELKTPINLLVSRASAIAIEAIEAAGGSVTTRYYNEVSIKRILKGHAVQQSFTPLAHNPAAADASAILAQAKAFQYRIPDPTSRKDIEYYRDPAHRGYLSHTVPAGHGPSLFYKTPFTGVVHKKKIVGGIVKSENRIW
jgi:large subunit ribosomal protein L15